MKMSSSMANKINGFYVLVSSVKLLKDCLWRDDSFFMAYCVWVAEKSHGITQAAQACTHVLLLIEMNTND